MELGYGGTKDKLKVFLCHASENKPIVNDLYDDLVAAGYEPWLDTEVLLPGMDWDLEIKKGLRASDAVIVCLSSISVEKEGYIQKELRFAQGYSRRETSRHNIPNSIAFGEMRYSV